MDSIILATFQNLQDAENGLEKIKELDLLEDIDVNNILLVQKKLDTGFQFLYKDGPDTKHFPEKGAIAGSIIGALTGPMGIVIGMMAGGISGSLDKYNADIAQEELLDRVEHHLKTGDYAIVMDVKEDDPALINFYLGLNHARISRTALNNVY